MFYLSKSINTAKQKYSITRKSRIPNVVKYGFMASKVAMKKIHKFAKTTVYLFRTIQIHELATDLP